MTSVGLAAFVGCSRLTSIAIPPGVTDMGEEIFSGCDGLKSITVPYLAIHAVEKPFHDSDTWALDATIAKFIVPRMKRFIELYDGFIAASEETMTRFQEILFAFEYFAEGKQTLSGQGEEFERAKRGLRYFAEDYRHLGW
jgi:hypothetical protein